MWIGCCHPRVVLNDPDFGGAAFGPGVDPRRVEELPLMAQAPFFAPTGTFSSRPLSTDRSPEGRRTLPGLRSRRAARGQDDVEPHDQVASGRQRFARRAASIRLLHAVLEERDVRTNCEKSMMMSFRSATARVMLLTGSGAGRRLPSLEICVKPIALSGCFVSVRNS